MLFEFSTAALLLFLTSALLLASVMNFEDNAALTGVHRAAVDIRVQRVVGLPYYLRLVGKPPWLWVLGMSSTLAASSCF